MFWVLWKISHDLGAIWPILLRGLLVGFWVIGADISTEILHGFGLGFGVFFCFSTRSVGAVLGFLKKLLQCAFGIGWPIYILQAVLSSISFIHIIYLLLRLLTLNVSG